MPTRRALFARLARAGRAGLCAAAAARLAPLALTGETAGEDGGLPGTVVALEQGVAEGQGFALEGWQDGETDLIDNYEQVAGVVTASVSRGETFAAGMVTRLPPAGSFPVATRTLMPRLGTIFDANRIWAQDGLFYTVEVDPAEGTVVHYALSTTQVLVRATDGVVRLLRIVP